VRCEVVRWCEIQPFSAQGYSGDSAMPTDKQRLAVRIFRLIEGEAEGPLAISVLFIIALAVIAAAVWGLRS